MRLLPRSLEYRKGDTPESVGERLAIWTRDVIAALRLVPDVTYTTITAVDLPLTVAVDGGAPRSVLVARVVSGTVSAAPGVEWSPAATGFTLTAVHGVTGTPVLALRVEV